MSTAARAIWALLYLFFVTLGVAFLTGIFARLWWDTLLFGWGLVG